MSTNPVDIKVTKILGGGESWFYAIRDGRIIGASHEDDKEGMERLRELCADTLKEEES